MRLTNRSLAKSSALVLVVLAAACSGLDQTPSATMAGASILDSADQVAFGSRTLVTDGGLLRAEIFADTTLFLEQNTRISMRVVKGDFFNAVGAKDATMVGQRAMYDTRTGTLEGWGNVIITSVDGRVLRSPMVRYDPRLNQVMSDSSFVMTEPDGKVIRGVGFRADPDLNVVNVLRLDQGRGGTINLTPSPTRAPRVPQ